MPDRGRKVLIVGAASAIAEAVARRLAARGDELLLAGRDGNRLTRIADDLRVRGSPVVQIATFDVARLDDHPRFVEDAWQTLGPFDIVLLAYGTLPDQKACEASVEQAIAALNVNLLGTVSLLTLIANRMEAQARGTIAVITSVAGDRGRQSNYVYGAAKGGMTRFLQGLRHRLHGLGVKVVDIKPGFVDTPMTEAIPKGGPLWATPAQVARDIERALDRGDAEIYTPWFWRWIMLVVRTLPTAVFHKTKL